MLLASLTNSGLQVLKRAKMKIRDLYNEVTTLVGMGILNAVDYDLGDKSFLIIVNKALNEYNQFLPSLRTFNITVGNQDYLFTASSKIGIPDNIYRALPIYSTGKSGGPFLNRFALVSGGYSRFASYRHRQTTSDIEVPIEIPWRYDKPTLYIRYGGLIDVGGLYYHKVTDIPEYASSEDDTILDGKEITTLNPITDEYFERLVRGLFMQTLSSARGMFSLEDASVTVNFEAMKTESEQLLEQVREELKDNVLFSVSWQ